MTYYPTCKPKNLWCSIDAHCQEVVGILSLAFWPIKAANIMILDICSCTALELSKRHDQKSLTLRWSSFSGGTSVLDTSIFAYKGGQYYHYGSMPLHSPWIMQDARPIIVDALLTLMFRRWFFFFFCFIHTVCTLSRVWQDQISPPPPGELARWRSSPPATLHRHS